MVHDYILGGLHSALARGQSLKQAMMSFHNAGYPQLDIEEAVKALKSENLSQAIQIQQVKQIKPTQLVVSEKPGQTIQKVSYYLPQPAQVQQPNQIIQQQFQATQQPIVIRQVPVIQNVSSYDQIEKPAGKAAVYILVTLLLILLGALATVFFFKDEIIAFFSSS